VTGAGSRTVNAAAKSTKAELLSALRESYDICDGAFGGLTEAGVSQMVRLGQSTRERSKLALHAGDDLPFERAVWGYMSVYLRLRASCRRPARRRNSFGS